MTIDVGGGSAETRDERRETIDKTRDKRRDSKFERPETRDVTKLRPLRISACVQNPKGVFNKVQKIFGHGGQRELGHGFASPFHILWNNSS